MTPDSPDTDPRVAELVAARYRSMTPSERCQIASSMYEMARTIVESSLPAGLTREQRRLAVARRFYGDDLPESMLIAYAIHPGA